MFEHLRFREPHCHSSPPLYKEPPRIFTRLVETTFIHLHFSLILCV